MHLAVKMITGKYNTDSCIKFKFVNYSGTQSLKLEVIT